MATAVKTWSTNETLTASDLNAEFSNVYSSAVDLTSAQTISGIKTHSADIILQDSVNLTFGTGSDATIDYDGTNLLIDPKVVGSGYLGVDGGLVVNDSSADVDVRVESNGLSHALYIDGGKDALAFGANSDVSSTDTPFLIDYAARTATAATNFDRFKVGGTNAVTIPAGTTALVTGAHFAEPNITATGTVTTASTVYIAGAPSEGGTNYALWVDAGNVQFDGDLNITGAITAGSGISSAITALNNATENELVTVGATTTELDAEANLTWDGSKMGVGIASPDGTMHVHSASAGTIAAHADYDELVIEGSGNTGINILSGNASTGGIAFGDDGDNDWAYVSYDHSAHLMTFSIAGNRVMTLDGVTERAVFIGDETSNANMTVGLTINQGANDDEILAFKSSDVGTGLSTGNPFGTVEADDFAVFKKAQPTLGGLALNVVGENSASLSTPLYMQITGGQADTTKTTGGTGLAYVQMCQHNGSNSAADLAANGNAFAVNVRKSGSFQTVWIVDEDGDYHYDGADGGAFDTYADAEMVRAFALSTSNPAQVIRSRWDEMVRYQKDDLVAAGIIGCCSPEEEAQGHRGLVNGAQVQRLHTGAIWQTHVEVLELKEAADTLRAELDNERSKRMALETRLNLIEQKGRN